MPKPESFSIGEIAYEPESILGRGGSAEVWEARRRHDDQVFAVKRIEKDPSKSPARIKRFEQEIDYGQTANHPNVVKIHARLEDADCFYYVMDLYPKTLRIVVSDESDADLLLDYARQLSDALAYVHPVENEDRFTQELTAAGAPPILVVGGRLDDVSPHHWAEAMTERLEDAVLLTHEGVGHSSYRTRGPCIDDAVDTALIDGVLPADGTVCDVPPATTRPRAAPTAAGE
jgi:pimeloyl-ACP methyl ester carboxylesterase